MTTRTVTGNMERNEKDVTRIIKVMTAAAWVLLGIGLILSIFSIDHFSDRNTALMVGIGFMVGSVFVYVIRTAIHLVHSRITTQKE